MERNEAGMKKYWLKRGIKNIIMFSFCTAMIMLLHMTALADTPKNVVLQLPESKAEVQMKLYKLAEYDGKDYVYTEDFDKCEIDIPDIDDVDQSEDAASLLTAYVMDNNIQGTVMTADAEGKIRLENLPPALYLVTQASGKEVILIQSLFVPIPFNSASLETDDVVLTPKYSFPKGAFIALKVNEKGEALGKASFVLEKKIYDNSGDFSWKTFPLELTSVSNGQIVIADIDFGEYRLVEKEAPEGYKLDETPVYFEIEKAGKVIEKDGRYVAESGEVVERQIVNYPEDEPSVEEPPAENPPADKPSADKPQSDKPAVEKPPVEQAVGLPKTGDDSNILLYGALLMLSVMAVIVLIKFAHRKRIR